ncbi:unnamed protein product [Brachionus calyciflorus]|uniref:Uncharacterized protein n=1 Tax=Brachionus calyciflorus TaxID=104777 RepID=A0A813P7B0_9BILA|nr:unnamed protein product [Brachionus calyciflorus]
MRIYHDNSIDHNIICELECANQHVEFCNIHNLPLGLTNFDKVFNLNYIHSMKWRFLAIGDSFVDHFMSRDLDSMIIRREFDSVREWLDSDNVGHIMRDNVWHNVSILGGMWGFKNSEYRRLGREIFKLIIDKKIAKKYNKNGKSRKDYDQLFLENYFYNRIYNISTIHDSFYCDHYPNSKPFPSKRVGDCFIGRVGFCNESNTFRNCPISCRPKDHLDWSSC